MALLEDLDRRIVPSEDEIWHECSTHPAFSAPLIPVLTLFAQHKSTPSASTATPKRLAPKLYGVRRECCRVIRYGCTLGYDQDAHPEPELRDQESVTAGFKHRCVECEQLSRWVRFMRATGTATDADGNKRQALFSPHSGNKLAASRSIT